MNKKRREFLERNTDPQIKTYIFGQGHSCDIPDRAKIDCFRWYDYDWVIKGRNVKGVMLLPDYKNQWSEDKIWFVSRQDAEFFVKWYNENHGASAVLIDADEC